MNRTQFQSAQVLPDPLTSDRQVLPAYSLNNSGPSVAASAAGVDLPNTRIPNCIGAGTRNGYTTSPLAISRAGDATHPAQPSYAVVIVLRITPGIYMDSSFLQAMLFL